MNRTFGIAAVLAVLLLGSGCSDDTSAQVTEAPAPGFGRASADDLAHLALPIYPYANASDSDVVKKTKDGLHSITLMTTTYQPYASVDAWYAAHLDIEFRVSHLGSASDGQSSIYADREPDDAPGPPSLQRSVKIEPAKDATGRAIEIITLATVSDSTVAPHKDWY
jgi:hypothetical protein